ncbi:transposase, IS605 OrfB family protein, partial [Thermotoga sp. Xyl54]
MSRYVRTYKVPVPVELYPLCSELNRIAARIYNKTMSLVKKIKNKRGKIFCRSFGKIKPSSFCRMGK